MADDDDDDDVIAATSFSSFFWRRRNSSRQKWTAMSMQYGASNRPISLLNNMI